jgi:hypothetical protein
LPVRVKTSCLSSESCASARRICFTAVTPSMTTVSRCQGIRAHRASPDP